MMSFRATLLFLLFLSSVFATTTFEEQANQAHQQQGNQDEEDLLASAQKACATVKGNDFEKCVSDVVAVGDLAMAEFWQPPRLRRRRRLNSEKAEKELFKKAKEACQYVKKGDQQLCIDDVMATGDLEMAEFWPKSLPQHYD